MSTPVANLTEVFNFIGSELLAADKGDSSAAYKFQLKTLAAYLGNYTVANLRTGNTAADNILALQGAINEAEANRLNVLLPSGNFNMGAGGIVCKGGVPIHGVRPKLTFQENCPDLGWNASGGTILTGLSNTVDKLFVAFTAGSSTPLHADVTGLSNVSFSNFAVAKFGYGMDFGSENMLGMAFGEIDSVFFEDIYSESMRLINPQQLEIKGVKCSRVKMGLHMKAFHGDCAPGNSRVDGFYAYLADPANPSSSTLKNACQGILLDTQLAQNRTGEGTLNYISFNRPQINRFGGTIAGVPLIKVAGASSGVIPVTSAAFHDLDTEGEASYHIELTNSRLARVNYAQCGGSAGTRVAVMDLNDAKYTRIDSAYANLTIDADANSDPFYVNGMVEKYISGGIMGIGMQHFAVNSRTLLVTKSSGANLYELNQANGTFGPSKFDPFTLTNAKTTWAIPVDLPVATDQSGNKTMYSDGSGIYPFTNASNAVATLGMGSGEPDGVSFVIYKKSGAGTLTLDAGAGRTIGGGSQTLALGATVGNMVHVKKLGTDWIIMSSRIL